MPINASADLTVQQQITAVYIAYYDRAPDPAGLQFWVDQVQGGRSLAQVANDFSTAAETTAKYPYFAAPDVASADTFITSVYTNLFGRAPDSAGLTFWSDQLSSGSTPVGEIILAILEGAQDVTGGADDKSTVTNKIEVGVDWAVSATEAGIGLSTPIAEEKDGQLVVNNQNAFDSATALLDSVDGTAASVTAAKATTDTFITDETEKQEVGETFTLTASSPSITEGDAGTKSLTFTLTLDEAPTEATTINYETLTSGTATAGDDFNVAAGTVEFAAGQTVATVPVTVNGDTDFEADETVQVQFSGDALDADVTATGTITNDDVDPSTVTQTFTLTDGVDNIEGTANNDVLNGVVMEGTDDTTNLADTIDMAGGTDTVNAILAGNADSANNPTFTNAEIINLDDRAGVTLDDFETIFEAATSLNLTNKTSAYDVSDIDFDQTKTVLKSVTGNVAIDGTVTATGDQTVNVGLDEATTVTLTVDGGANATDLDLSVTGASQLADIVATDAAMVNLSIEAEADLELTDISDGDITDLTLTGSGSVNLDAQTGGDIATVAASASTGNNELIGLDGTETLDVTMGSGDDFVGVVGAIAATDEIEGGGGTNTLGVDANGDYASVTNFTKLAALDGVAGLDVSTLSGLTDVTFTPATDAQNLTIDEAATALNYAVNDARLAATGDIGNFVLDPLAETMTGTSDTYNVSIDASLEGVDTTVADQATLTIDDIQLVQAADNGEAEVLNLEVGGTRNVEVLTMTDEELETLNITASTAFTLGSGAAVTVEEIDGSASSGDLDITLGAADQEVTGGSGDDTFNIGDNSTADDTIVGGAGDDTITMTETTSGGTKVAGAFTAETVRATLTIDGLTSETTTVDASNIVAADTLEIVGDFTDDNNNGNATVMAVTGLTSAVGKVQLSNDFEDGGNDDLDVSLALDDANGSSDSLTVNLFSGNGNTTADEAVTQTISGLNANDIEAITLTMDEGIDEGVTTISDLNLDAATTLMVSGDGALIVSNAADVDAIDTVDLSTMSGGFDLAEFGSGATFRLGAIADGENSDNIDPDGTGGNSDAFSSITLFDGQQDTIEFTDLSNSIVIRNVEGGGDISDDDFDFSALGISFSDLTFTDGNFNANGGANSDVKISSAEFDGDIYIIGSTSADLNQNDFLF